MRGIIYPFFFLILIGHQQFSLSSKEVLPNGGHYAGYLATLLFKTLAQWLSKPLPAPVLWSAVP